MLNDSLSNQFQGAFLGFALGYKLGQLSCSEIPNQPIPSQLNLSVLPKRMPGMTPVFSSVSPRDQVTLLHKLTQSILQHQGLNAVDYEEQWKTWVQSQPVALMQVEKNSLLPVASQGIDLPNFEFSSEGELAIFALPMALLFHDNLKPLQNFLLKREEDGKSWGATPRNHDGVLALAIAIAQLLTAKLEPNQLIPQILPKLSSKTTLGLQLEQVQLLLEQNASLEIVVRHLIQTAKMNRKPGESSKSEKIAHQWTATALAFYCFLSTPSDYRLTLWRAIQTGYQPEVTSAISGVLSGAYQGLSGIPVHWRLNLKKQVDSAVNSNWTQNATVESKTGEKQLLQLANQLLAVWSGVFNPITSEDTLRQIYVTTAKATSSVLKPER